MICVKTVRPCYSLLVSRPYHPFRFPVRLGPLRAYSMETPLPSHGSLHGLNNELVIDTTPGTAQVSGVLDGAALEVYGVIPYTAVCKDSAVRFEIVGPGQLMRGVEQPMGYSRESWLDQVDLDGPGMGMDV